MANGDAAAAKGMSVVGAGEDRRLGYDEINKTRDYLAAEIDERTAAVATRAASTHNHSASQITSGTLAVGRIPDLPASKITSGTLDASRIPSDARANGPGDDAYARTPTGSGWYAVWMNSSNQFMRPTSSRRYKEDVQALHLTPDLEAKLLELEPSTYHRKGQRPGTREIGLIAEDCVNIPGLVTWDVPRKADGLPRKGGVPRPEAVRYEQVLPVYLLALVQSQQRQIEALNARLDALEGAGA